MSKLKVGSTVMIRKTLNDWGPELDAILDRHSRFGIVRAVIKGGIVLVGIGGRLLSLKEEELSTDFIVTFRTKDGYGGGGTPSPKTSGSEGGRGGIGSAMYQAGTPIHKDFSTPTHKDELTEAIRLLSKSIKEFSDIIAKNYGNYKKKGNR